MKCGLAGCQGEMGPARIHRTVEYRGQVVVFSRVPAWVCPLCGCEFVRPEIRRRLESIARMSSRPEGLVPLYEYADWI